MKKIGITGGIGSGKSAVCMILKSLGIHIYDADSRAKWLSEHDAHLIEEIKKHFGIQSFTDDGKLNRTYIASIVFQDERQRQILNNLVHPAVAKDFESWFENLPKTTPYALKEAALMIEAGSYKGLDALILVTAPKNLRIERVKKRDPQRSESEIINIIDKQMPDEEKKRFADFVIENDGKNSLIKKVLEVHAQLKRFSE